MTREAWVAAFEKPKTSPAMFVAEETATTVMGPYLKFGCVSVKKMYREVCGLGERGALRVRVCVCVCLRVCVCVCVFV